ncbi:MAG TPA: hypothetical protein DCE44_05510, partial [Verrucomicrobiales bacterium]|nr:hypothetical protein [Verrucomicrobiales bacterium]
MCKAGTIAARERNDRIGGGTLAHLDRHHSVGTRNNWDDLYRRVPDDFSITLIEPGGIQFQNPDVNRGHEPGRAAALRRPRAKGAAFCNNALDEFDASLR